MGVPNGLNLTGILWAKMTWNPFSGCEAVDDVCKYCYAKTIAERYAGTSAFPNGFGYTFRPNRMNAPRRLQEPATIFPNSMSDLFWSSVPGDVRVEVFNVMRETPQHIYFALTKRALSMQRFSEISPFPSNVWAGVSIGRRSNLKRLDQLRNTAARIRFVSFGPVLENLGRVNLAGVDWAIVEGESGAHLHKPAIRAARALVDRTLNGWQPDPRKVRIVRRLRDQCLDRGVALFFKQWGGPFDHAAGRELDGETWSQYPIDIPRSMLNPGLFPVDPGQGELAYEEI